MSDPLFTAGIDVGSTYTKAVLLDIASNRIAASVMLKTGYKLADAARRAYEAALLAANAQPDAVRYVIGTGYGRLQVEFADVHVTDLTSAARGAAFLFPHTRTILDIGGQTMKASRVDAACKVRSFRLNDKCAAGTGAFLEKTARYLGYSTEEIGPLAAMSKAPVPISGVCAVFAESEVINSLSHGASPSDIMQGAMQSLVDRSIQLMRRVRLEPEYTVVGGILRFDSMGALLREKLGSAENIPSPDLVQFVGAIGAATVARRRALASAADLPVTAAASPL
jgi:predicted CoA-substrate-specific enzyme activase